MRNAFAGTCFRCGLSVEPNMGHFRRDRGKWLVHHANFSGHGRITCEAAKKMHEAAANKAEASLRAGDGVMSEFIAGMVAMLGVCILVFGINKGLHNHEIRCSHVYGDATREFAICVYELQQGLRKGP